ncbi:MAG: PAS domain S-box protein [Acidobacteriota bacterium]
MLSRPPSTVFPAPADRATATASNEVRELRDAAQWYRKLIDGTDNLILQLDAGGHIQFANPASRSIFGAEPSELMGGDLLARIDKDDRSALAARFRRWRESARRPADGAAQFQHRVISSGGSVRDVLWTANPRHENGELVAIYLLGQDITERRRAARVHQVQSQVLESMAEGVTLTHGGYILYTNPALNEMFGYRAGELIGRRLAALSAGDDALRTIGNGLGRDGSWAGEVEQERKDGAPILTRVRMTAIEIDGRVHWVSVFDDITEERRAAEERRQLELRVQRAHRLEGLERMAGGVAHDFNNLLMVILGNTSLALQGLDRDDARRRDLEQIEEATLRATELTRQMLAFSGTPPFAAEPVRLSDLIARMEPLVRSSIPRSVGLELDLDTDLPPIEIDVGQLRQAILALVTNAAEAIGDAPGRVRITAGRRWLEAGELGELPAAEPLAAGDYLAIAVHDDGDGMEPEVATQIFDPFFTTKFTGRGLGLAAALGIVRGHGGTIAVDSAPGDGSTMTILLPMRPRSS